MTAEELLDEGPPGPRTAVLTFDDGFRNWLTAAVPLLRRLGVRATFYVCPGFSGAGTGTWTERRAGCSTRSEAQELLEAGMELGSHSLSHPDLRLLDGGELSRELEESKREVERLTGRPCRTLAYPYGLYDERVVSAARAAGYELAFDLAARPLASARGAAAAGSSSPRLPTACPQAHGTAEAWTLMRFSVVIPTMRREQILADTLSA